MSRSSPIVCWLTCLTLSSVAPVAAAQVTAARDATSPDARLRALYTAEWTWRQRELARGDGPRDEAAAAPRFPRVDPASQQARLAYWTRTLASLDSIPFDRL